MLKTCWEKPLQDQQNELWAGAIHSKPYKTWWLLLIGQEQEAPPTLSPHKLCRVTYKIRAKSGLR